MSGRPNRLDRLVARSSSGLALLEVLLSLLVLTVGLVGLLRLQSQLRLSAEWARQRAEAARLAHNELERLRSLPWTAQQALGDSEPVPAEGSVFSLARRVRPAAAGPLTALNLSAHWSDRLGDPQQLELTALLPALDPSLAGLLGSTGPGGLAAAAAAAAARGLPIWTQPLGDGRSAGAPVPGVVWVFDAGTAQIVQTCSGNVAARRDCQDAAGWLVSGHVWFATGTDRPGRQAAEHPDSPAMDLDLCLAPTDRPVCDPALPAVCLDDAPAQPDPAQRVVTYHCVVLRTAGSAHWTGRLNLVPRGWALAGADGAATGWRVCRYSFDHNRNGRIDNLEHPSLYTQVQTPLTAQNFLVVRGSASCPLDDPPGPGSAPTDNAVNDSTVPHQP